MADLWLRPTRIFDEGALQSGRDLLIRDGHVVAIAAGPDTAVTLTGCISPGFVDVQVNGGGGTLFNNDPTPAGIARIAQAHRRYGTVAIMPTIISDTPEVLDRAAAAVIAARAMPEIIGLHIEGPHIAAAKRGTHRAEDLRPLDARTLTVVQGLRGRDIPVMITLAPEAARPPQIAALAQMGAVVALGHTDASASDIGAAIAAGARCGTHLFNAMSQMQARAPGAVGAILGSGIPFGLICDGHHVDDLMIRLALRAAAPDCAFLVSDAMATIGGPPQFSLYGQTITLRDGRLVNAEGNLAGAHFTQAMGVTRLLRDFGIGLEQALRMAVTTPAKLVGQPQHAALGGRDIRDLLLVSDDGRVTPLCDGLPA